MINGKHGQGTYCTKWVLIVWPKIPQMAQNLSAQIVCPFQWKRLHWASVVRGSAEADAYLFSLSILKHPIISSKVGHVHNAQRLNWSVFCPGNIEQWAGYMVKWPDRKLVNPTYVQWMILRCFLLIIGTFLTSWAPNFINYKSVKCWGVFLKRFELVVFWAWIFF